MLFSTWLRDWKLSLERRSAQKQTRRRKPPVRHVASRLRLEALEDRTLLSAYIVTTTADSGPGSLRDAINQINADTSHALYGSPSNPNVDEMDFNITAASDAAGGGTGYNATTGVATIQPLSALPAITAPVIIDGTSQPGYNSTPLIVLSGINAGSQTVGLDVTAGDSTLKGLVINQFGFDGIDLTTNGGNMVEDDYIGTDATGSSAAGNGVYGVYISSDDNTIGGTAAGARDVISGNLRSGVYIYSGDSNRVQGNFIGVDTSGNTALGNLTGIDVAVGQFNVIGVDATNNPAAANVISGNIDYGVGIERGGNNVVAGNLVGLGADGSTVVGNRGDGGIIIDADSSGNTIGGTTAAARNVISGNQNNGIGVGNDDGTAGNVIEGNYIGTDSTGLLARSNTGAGVWFFGAGANTLGGTALGAGNVISGNGTGVYLSDGTTGVQIESNLIGVNATDTAALGNQLDGVAIGGPSGAIGNSPDGSTDNTVRGNVIGGNSNNGVEIFGSGVTGNVVVGNYIGTDASGTANLGNAGPGVVIENGATNNTVGGTTSGAGNTIAFNTAGVIVQGVNTNGDTILGDSIHDNRSLGINLTSGANDNQAPPVLTSASSSSSSTTVSGTLASVANTTFRIEFFSNADLDTSGDAEGLTYFGFTTLTTDGNGNATFTATNLSAIPIGQGYLTATATNLSTGDTSEFSNYLTAPTSTGLTSSANPSQFGQQTTFTATVTSSFGTPTGSVDFYDTTTNTDLGSATLSGGVATLSTSALGVGTHVIQATYSGEGPFLGSNSTLAQVVNKAMPYFSLVAPPTIIDGTSNTQITGAIAAGLLIPPSTETVTVTVNGVNYVTAINADGTFAVLVPTASLGTGSYTIGYSYAGDNTFTSASAAANMDVTNGVLVLSNQSHAKNAGSTIPIQIELVSASGQDVSSASTTVTAMGIAATTDTTDTTGYIDPSQVGALQPVQAAGNSNPNNVFREQGGSKPFYMYNLQTPTGLTAGTYRLYFQVQGDPLWHWVTFTVS